MPIRRVRAALCAAALSLLCLPAPSGAQLRSQLITSGLQRPVAIVADPLNPGTLLVPQQNGLILAVVNGEIQPTPFLDLQSVTRMAVEEGMLGLAVAPFDPNVIFVSFTGYRDPLLPFPTFEFGDTVVARFRRTSNPLVVDPASRVDLRWPVPFPGLGKYPFVYQPSPLHKGGNLVFGPDGYLYIGFGEGGLGNDPMFNAQNPAHLLGKMVRIDVNVPDGHPTGYTVPADNPFVDSRPIAALGEIWSFGFRNPWRFSFDDFGPGATGAMIIGDVGQDTREEIDYEPAGRGGRNYGWYIREGAGTTPGISPATPPAYGPLTDPIADYAFGTSQSVTGGFVYRGSQLPWPYHGRYFVADFFGRTFSLGLNVAGNGEAQVADVMEHTGELGNPRLIPTFGRDLDGELYYASFMGGSIYKIVPDTSGPPPDAPTQFTGRINGSTVTLSWQPGPNGGPALGYQLEAGMQPGAADAAVMQTRTPSLVVPGVPNGTFYVRVRAINSSGVSAASAELPVRVGCGGVAPAPSGLTGSASGLFASASWNGTADALSYLVDLGTTSGGTELGSLSVTGTSIAGIVAPGTYYVRVRAVTACGTSGPSNEAVVTVE